MPVFQKIVRKQKDISSEAMQSSQLMLQGGFDLRQGLKSTTSQLFVFTTIFSPENRSTPAGQLP